MYAFFMIFGYLFITTFASLTNYIYEIFPINKITNFLLPFDNKSIWNKISPTVLPIIIWSFIEIPILGNNENFALSIILNIIISCAIIYEIKYSALLFLNKENNIINLISIYFSTIFGQLVSFMILKIKPLFNNNMLSSIIWLLIITGIYIIVKLYPPKTDFFMGRKKETKK